MSTTSTAPPELCKHARNLTRCFWITVGNPKGKTLGLQTKRVRKLAASAATNRSTGHPVSNVRSVRQQPRFHSPPNPTQTGGFQIACHTCHMPDSRHLCRRSSNRAWSTCGPRQSPHHDVALSSRSVEEDCDLVAGNFPLTISPCRRRNVPGAGAPKYFSKAI